MWFRAGTLEPGGLGLNPSPTTSLCPWAGSLSRLFFTFLIWKEVLVPTSEDGKDQMSYTAKRLEWCLAHSKCDTNACVVVLPRRVASVLSSVLSHYVALASPFPFCVFSVPIVCVSKPMMWTCGNSVFRFWWGGKPRDAETGLEAGSFQSPAGIDLPSGAPQGWGCGPSVSQWGRTLYFNIFLTLLRIYKHMVHCLFFFFFLTIDFLFFWKFSTHVVFLFHDLLQDTTLHFIIPSP